MPIVILFTPRQWQCSRGLQQPRFIVNASRMQQSIAIKRRVP